MFDDPYETGYGKPPKHRQFVKGESGNPKGRPKGSRNFATTFFAVAHQKVKITENGKTRVVSKFEASVMQLFSQSSAGKAQALQLLAMWARIFAGEVEELKKSGPPNKQADRTVMENILKRILANPGTERKES